MPTVVTVNRDDLAVVTPEREKTNRSTPRQRIRLVVMCCILLCLLFVMGGFVSNYIPSESMEPMLSPGDHVLTLRSWLAYPMGSDPGRGDIIVFRLPSQQLDTGGADRDDSGPAEAATSHDRKPAYTILIKRVIGLPGDTVQVKGNVVFVNGKPLKEEYRVRPAVDPDSKGYEYAYEEPLKVKAGELFVLGDNRNNSDDGRFWGTLKREDVIGKFVHVLYNEGRHGPTEQIQQAFNSDTQ